MLRFSFFLWFFSFHCCFNHSLFYIKKFYEPDLQVKLLPFLHSIANASIDISDGLLQDLKHLCDNSKCSATVKLDKIPFSNVTKKILKSKKINIKDIFSNGDDYQILFTSNLKNRKKILSLSKKLNTKISRIGFINKGKKINLLYKMKKIEINDIKMGYIHNFQ